MTGLIRKAVFLALGSVLVASAAMAGVPGWGGSDQPSFIKVGGTVGGVTDPFTSTKPGNPPVPDGLFYRIVDANLTPVIATQVQINFSGCPDIGICTNQNAGFTAVGKVVTGTTDGLGRIVFRIRGGSNAAVVGAFHSAACATVSLVANPSAVGGLPLQVAAFDLNVNGAGNTGGVGADDLAILGFDLNLCAAGTYRARSDFNGSGVGIGAPCPGVTGVDAGDLAEFGFDANLIVSSLNCGVLN